MPRPSVCLRIFEVYIDKSSTTTSVNLPEINSDFKLNLNEWFVLAR